MDPLVEEVEYECRITDFIGPSEGKLIRDTVIQKPEKKELDDILKRPFIHFKKSFYKKIGWR